MALKAIPNLPDDQYNARWIARLMQRSRPGQNGCIEVDGWHNADGYANAFHRKYGDFPHRVIMILIHGPIPEGMMACHKCGNHGCVNPDHLYIGTMKQNARDTVNMGRHLEANKTHCAQGHEFTPENTYRYRNKRKCRTCQKEWHKAPGYVAWRREYQAKRRALKREQRQSDVPA